MTSLDLVLVLCGMVITATLIRFVQSRPVEGLVGVMDLIIPHKDPRDRLLSLSLTSGVPLIVGGILSIFAHNQIAVAMIGPSLGAFTSISSAFFRPDLLPKFVQERLLATRITYLSFVVGYALLGAVASLIVKICIQYFQEGDVVNNMTASLIWWMVAATAVRGVTWLSTTGLKPPELSVFGVEALKKDLGQLIHEEVHAAFRAAAPSVMFSLEESDVTSGELKRSIPDAIREELQSIRPGDPTARPELGLWDSPAVQAMDPTTLREIIRFEIRKSVREQRSRDYHNATEIVENPTEEEKASLLWYPPDELSPEGYYYRFRYGGWGVFG